MDIYREDILEHYKHPQNFGELPDADVTARSSNPACGDEMVMQVKSEKSPPKADQPMAEKVKSIMFHGQSCAISRAGASMLTEEVKGKTLEEIQAVSDETHLARFGKDLAPGRVKCAMLSLVTLRQVIKALKEKEERPTAE